MKNQIEPGALYVVATPIGNLQDITLRALAVFKAAEVIFAEDTRVTRKLLDQYAIKPPLIVSCHEHNESSRIEQVIQNLADNKVVLLVSDAGTPLISDPGFTLIKAIKNQGYKAIPIPGVNALITALSVAGVPTESFEFKGFLSPKKLARHTTLIDLKHSTGTTAFYESTHRIIATLASISEILPTRHIVVAKELTKQFERLFEGYASDILQQFSECRALTKGEFVILIEGVNEDALDENIEKEDHILGLLLAELPIKKAVALTVKLTSGKKNALYKRALTMQSEASNIDINQTPTHQKNGCA